MLIERADNPWIQFKVLWPDLERGQRSLLAKRAFLHLIARYDASRFQKEKSLAEIAELCPGILDPASGESHVVSDREILQAFRYLYQDAKRRREILSPEELTWARLYVKDREIYIIIEKMIYQLLLGASSHWDKIRGGFKWAISEEDKLKLARQALKDTRLGSKRKLEIAREFGEPEDDFATAYFRKLLWDRHYDKAQESGLSDPRIALEVVVDNINSGYFSDAFEIVRRFLPERTDLIQEIQRIKSAFE